MSNLHRSQNMLLILGFNYSDRETIWSTAVEHAADARALILSLCRSAPPEDRQGF
jgi:hypothetical protein